MKRFLASVLVVSTISTFAACGKSAENEKAKAANDLAPRIARLKKVGRAMYESSKANDGFFPAFDSNGWSVAWKKNRKHGLSWRVYILPYLGYKQLYAQFKLDEPWDGPNNKKLLGRMPDEYQTHGVKDEGKTSLHVFIGPPMKRGFLGIKRGQVPFGSYADGASVGPKLRDITDGTPNTLMIVEAGSDKAEPWTKPTGLMYDAKGNPLKALGTTDEEGYLFLYFYGTPGRIKKTIATDQLRLLLEYDDRKTDRKAVDFPGVERLK